MDFEELYQEIHRCYPDLPFSRLRNAYYLAENMHHDQKRASGEPYIIHPIAVTRILLNYSCDEDML
nr:hypothetical protein [Candidatus Gracilibacteria bacterium]